MDQNTRRTVSICFQVDYAPVGAGAVRSGVGTLASPWCLTSPQILTGVVRSGVGTLASPWCLTSPQILTGIIYLNWNHLDVESEAICA